MKDRKDAAKLPIKDEVPIRDGTPHEAASHLQTTYARVVAATSSTLNDNQDRRDASNQNVSQRSTHVRLKTSKSGFPIAKAAVPGRATERTGSAFHQITTAAKSEAGPIVARPAAATSAPAAKLKLKLKPASRLTNPAHLKSAQKAARAFENFSLSKFAKDKVPENYVDPQKANDPKAVQDVQRELIRRQLRTLPDTDTQNSGVTIAFPVAKLEQVKKALPGIGEHGGEVKLDDLLTYLRGRMNGTTFYSRGNPTMKRLTAEMQARSQARAIIERVKKRSNEKRTGTAQSGATQAAAASKSSPNVQVPDKAGRSKS
jgi:hypothetical protein